MRGVQLLLAVVLGVLAVAATAGGARAATYGGVAADAPQWVGVGLPSGGAGGTDGQPNLPTVKSIKPSSGPIAGGNTVTIVGTNLSETSEVDFGKTRTQPTSKSSTEVTATAPPGTGTIDITVTTSCGHSDTSSGDRYTYVSPTVTGISQTSGPSAGGTLVTITGSGFLNGSGSPAVTAVDFGTTPASDVKVLGDTTITATAPPGTGIVDVTVMIGGATSATSPNDKFTYVPPAPVVKSVSPASGAATGGTSVTITGANFASPATANSATWPYSVTAVDFGSAAATAFTVNSATSITATSPAGSGTVDVTVTTAGGTSAKTAADQFSYQAAPAATGLPTSSTDPPLVLTATGAAFSGTVNPNGLQTTAYFEYSLDSRYTGASQSANTLDTAPQPVGADFGLHSVSATVSGLLPNAVYHVRLVATNSDGTTPPGPDRTFTTKADPAPPPPVLGKSVNVKPVKGTVFVRLPRSKSPYAKSVRVGSLVLARRGKGFVPLTEARRLPAGTQVDARQGTLNLVTATGKRHKTQAATLTGAIFGISQASRPSQKGLTTITLLEGLFPGAPSFAACKAHAAADASIARAALSSRVLQALRASDRHGNFRTRGRYSAATVRGTVWGVRDRCDGTLTTVFSGTVVVSDFATGKTITVHTGQTFLARPAAKKRK